jgi:hypothetical protein
MTASILSPDDQAKFDALWCYIWGRLELDDRDAQSMARRLNKQGVFTWEQWVDLNCFPA